MAISARTGTRVRGERAERLLKNRPSRAIAYGNLALASTDVCSAPNDDVMSATAIRVTAVAPMKRLATSVATDDDSETLAISVGVST